MVAFYDETTGWVDNGRAVDVVFIYVSKPFDTVSLKSFIDKWLKCRLGKWRERWTKIWLYCCAEIMKSSCRPVTSGVLLQVDIV